MNIRYYYLILAIVVALNIYWVISTPVLPFVDLPFRLAESVILRNYNNPGYLFSEFYVIPSLLKSNTFHTVFCSLSVLGSPETANKIYYCLYVFLMPVSSLVFIKKLKGNIFYSLMPVLFLLNHNVHWGFTGYTMSVPVLFLLFSVFHDYFISGIRSRIFVIGFFFILIFFLHFQSALFSLLVFGILNIVYLKKEIARFFGGFVTAIPVVLLMFISYLPDKDGNSTITFLLDYYKNSYLYSLPGRVQILFILDNFVLFEGISGIIYSASVSVLILAVVIFTFWKFPLKEIYRKYNFMILLLAVTLSCYLILPDNINGQNVIFERYSVLVFLLLIIFASAADKFRSRNLVIVIIASICIIHSALLIDYMYDFRNDSSDFKENIFPDGSSNTLSGIITGRNFRGRNVYAHFPMYYTVWKNGITSGIVDFRFGLIRRKASYDKLPHFIEWYDPQKNYNFHYRNIDYILFSGNEIISLENFVEYKKSGKWILYRNIRLTP